MLNKIKEFVRGYSVVTTHDLNEAAFYAVFGSKQLSIDGKYPNNTLTYEVKKWLSWYEKAGGFVPYNSFCNTRQKIKIKCRKIAGLPASFTGKKDYGFKMMDIATFKTWKK